MLILCVCSRPWVCYWILHSIALLGDSVDDVLERNTIEFLRRCQVSSTCCFNILFYTTIIRVFIVLCHLVGNASTVVFVLDNDRLKSESQSGVLECIF